METTLEITNGTSLFVGGIADQDAVKTLVNDNIWRPLLTEGGHAWAGVWITDAVESTLGAFQQVQVVFFGSEKELSPTPTKPLALLKELYFSSDLQMKAHGIRVDSPKVRDFYRDSFGWEVKLMHGLFQQAEDFWRIGYSDTESNEILLTGKLAKSEQQDARITVEMVRTFGLVNWLKLLGRTEQKITTSKIMTSYSADNVITRYFNPQTDNLIVQQFDYQDLNFRPGVVQEMSGVRMAIYPIN